MNLNTIRRVWFGGGLLLLVVLLSACQTAAATPTPTAEIIATEPVCPEQTPCPVVEDMSAQIPFYQLWADSAHADATSEAFRHWDEEDPQEIPAECAKCHSETGFMDFTGADASTPFSVEHAVAPGTVITCNACHNGATLQLSSVQFPSGVELTGLGQEAICMTCHQGAASMVQVDEAISAAHASSLDLISSQLGFVNVHYYAASVARFGAEVKGGYQYAGKAYDVEFEHVTGYQDCQDCHDPHSLAVKIDECAACHEDANDLQDIRDIRMASSLMDYDGDGNTREGLSYEIEGLQEILLGAIQSYASQVASVPIVYDENAYPYFFKDKNANGKVDEGEAIYPNKYDAFTPRLLKAAYNYQTTVKDPGGYAHGGKYLIELMYDSIDDLNSAITAPVDMTKLARTDAGHFDGSSEAFRHWVEDGVVPGACAKCHSSEGVPQLIAEGVNTSQSPSNGLMCETCHNDLTRFTLFEEDAVTFPSGAKLSFETDKSANLCLTCHQGRESTVSVNRVVNGLDVDAPSDSLNFRNVHYFAAGATLFGTDAKGVFEYPNKEYLGQFMHIAEYATCSDCHNAHELTVNESSCRGCHQVESLDDIRFENPAIDYDGDRNTDEGLKGEVVTMSEAVYAAIQAYAATILEKPIVYSPSAYPYFFADDNGNGVIDEGEGQYKSWSPRLLEAAYNYQYVMKDPGAYAHNGRYILQVLYDTLADLKMRVPVDMSGMVRP
jgi:hypothetical protein